MAHEYAFAYKLDPEFVKDNRNQYDFYEMKLMQVKKAMAQEYISEQKRKNKNQK